MRIADYEFEHICELAPLRGDDGSIRQFMPQHRYVNARNIPLNKYGGGPFCKFSIPKRFQVSGVYVITGDAILYVGECLNLSSRFNSGYGNISPKNCFKGGQETNCRLNSLVYSAIDAGGILKLWFFPTADCKTMESALRRVLKPAWNRI